MQCDLAVDAVGVNTHLFYPGIYTDNYVDIIKPRLIELGVRNIRDGNAVGNTTFDNRVVELSTLGIKFLMFVDTRFGLATDLTQAKEHIKLLNSAPSKPVLMLEGPNEFDCWDTTRATLSQRTIDIWNTFKNDAATASLPIAGPSFCDTRDSPGKLAAVFPDASNYMQYGNMHCYSGGNAVEGSLGGGWGMPLSQAVDEYKMLSGSYPLIASETGYIMSGDVVGFMSVTQRAAAKYMPRLFLTYLNYGIQRAYIYQLINNNQEDNGLLNTDGSPRLQYASIKNYISLLKDSGAAFTTDSLAYTLSGDLTNIQHILLQKRNGTFYLIVWQGVNSCDSGPVDVEPAAQALTLNLSTPIKQAKLYLPSLNDTSVQASYNNPTSINLFVPDHILVIELDPFKSVTTGLISQKINSNIVVRSGLSDVIVNVNGKLILKGASMRMYDMCGKEVKNIPINNYETIVSKAEFQRGIYLFDIINNSEKISTGKIAVQ